MLLLQLMLVFFCVSVVDAVAVLLPFTDTSSDTADEHVVVDGAIYVDGDVAGFASVAAAAVAAVTVTVPVPPWLHCSDMGCSQRCFYSS